MNGRGLNFVGLGGLVALAVGLLWWALGDSEEQLAAGSGGLPGAQPQIEAVPIAHNKPTIGDAVAADDAASEAEDDENGQEAVAVSEPIDPETAAVDAFDAQVDKWMEPSTTGVAMADVNRFSELFRQVPPARQSECIHRALNLIPDENVMLLAGVLMDKSANPEMVETVFNDILNRPEEVKRPILREIYKDKTHPCWADTAWILDVTGENGK